MTVSDGRSILRTGGDEIRLCRLGDVPLIGKAKKAEDIANVLAAVAAGWALGLTQEVISTGVKTFGLDLPEPEALLPIQAKKPLRAALQK